MATTYAATNSTGRPADMTSTRSNDTNWQNDERTDYRHVAVAPHEVSGGSCASRLATADSETPSDDHGQCIRNMSFAVFTGTLDSPPLR